MSDEVTVKVDYSISVDGVKYAPWNTFMIFHDKKFELEAKLEKAKNEIHDLRNDLQNNVLKEAEFEKEIAKLHEVILKDREITCNWANTGIIQPRLMNEFNHNSRDDVMDDRYTGDDERMLKHYNKSIERIHKESLKMVRAQNELLLKITKRMQDWEDIVSADVVVKSDDPETPKSMCPKCGIWVEDHDGFGVLAHGECGYCSHPSSTGGVCDICKNRWSTEKDDKSE